ncbi:MAG: Ig domain-containing protein, partial [Oscillospiraceae bacterium]|nr:Ig domain-containing protein [Oscillospiraceae bacterium]
MKIVRTTLSLLLILCLVLPMVPVSAAQISDTATAAPVGAEETAPQLRLDADCQLLRYVDEADFLSRGHIARFETEETLSSYVFLNPDGSKTVYFLDEPVKFQIGDGRIWEKDLTLTAVAGGYATTRNDVGLTLPTDPADGILLTYGGQQISLVPQGGVAAGEPEVTDNAVTYPDCFGTGISLRCTPTYSGLRAEPAAGAAVGSVSFTLNTGGSALCRSDDGWYLAGPDQSRIELGQATAVQVLEPSQSYRLTYPAATGLVLTVSQDGESLSGDQRIFRQLRGSNAFREKDPEEITSVELFTHSRSDRVDMTQTVKGWKSGTAETSAALTAASLTAESGTEDAAYAVMTYSNTIWFAYDFLDVASGKSGTASVSTNYAGDVTWASSDETIATVSKTGTYTATVTGVKSGIATITATLSNGESAAFTLYVTITNGIYFIGHSSLYIGVDGGMLENSEVKLWGKKSGGPAQLRQLWKIQHVERDYYSIRSAYRHDLA